MYSTSTGSATNGTTNGKQVNYTLTSLKRWSCDDRELPAVSNVKAIHVYDFDNTLFASPLPNKLIWTGPTVGQLVSRDVFMNGGWWHDSNILAATGEGVEKEEPRAWKGWWNEHIVSLVELTMQQKDALNVLLTGRSESAFAELVKRIVRSKKLEFDMVCLKPTVGPHNQKFKSTMGFKQELLKEIIYTYKEATEIRIYEDRPKHTQAFREFLFDFNKDLLSIQKPNSRKPLSAEVFQVAENATQLDQVSEIAEVQRMINSHNARVKAGEAPPGTPPYQIKKTVFYTGYMVPANVTEQLCSLVKLPPGMPESEIKYLSNSILITPKPCPRDILNKVGGIGNRVTWKVTGVSCYENKVWAARVEPVPKNQKYYSENPVPTVVLAIRKGGRPADAAQIMNWQPVPNEQAFVFESIVGEKKMLRIEEELPHESQYESFFPNKKQGENGVQAKDSRPQHPRGKPHDDRRGIHTSNYRGGNRDRGRGGNRNSSFGSRGGRGGGHNRGGHGGRGRGRGGASQYKSLDDVGERNYGQPNYDDPNFY